MNSIANQIEMRIKRWKKGRIFFPEDFLDIAEYENVRKTLTRLCNSGKIIRVAKGIFCYPMIDRKYGFGVIKPSENEIALAVAKHDNVKINPTGAYAMHALGLSTQVPVNAYFITNGSPRKIKISEKRYIIFTHSSRANDFAYKSPLMQLIVAAIKDIGYGLIREQERKILKEYTEKVPESDFRHDIMLAPEWVRKTIASL